MRKWYQAALVVVPVLAVDHLVPVLMNGGGGAAEVLVLVPESLEAPHLHYCYLYQY